MKAIKVPNAMCEAYEYDKPATFSRGVEVPLGDKTMIFVSGTAAVGADGKSKHKGDFESQAKMMFANVTEVLRASDVNWKDVVKTTIYIRDIDRDYESFNKIRLDFYKGEGIDIFPASTCIEAKICRSDLLCEMEAIAIK